MPLLHKKMKKTKRKGDSDFFKNIAEYLKKYKFKIIASAGLVMFTVFFAMEKYYSRIGEQVTVAAL